MFVSILPSHSGRMELALERLAAKAVDFDVPISSLVNPSLCPEDALPWLADYFSVDSWDPGWPPDIKRAVISASVDVHRRKGTVASVRQALAAAGYPNAEIIEFTNSGRLDDGSILDDGSFLSALSHWADYEVKIDQPLQTSRAVLLRAMLDQIAPARCRLVQIVARKPIQLDDGYILDDGWNLDATVILEGQ